MHNPCRGTPSFRVGGNGAAVPTLPLLTPKLCALGPDTPCWSSRRSRWNCGQGRAPTSCAWPEGTGAIPAEGKQEAGSNGEQAHGRNQAPSMNVKNFTRISRTHQAQQLASCLWLRGDPTKQQRAPARHRPQMMGEGKATARAHILPCFSSPAAALPFSFFCSVGSHDEMPSINGRRTLL